MGTTEVTTEQVQKIHNLLQSHYDKLKSKCHGTVGVNRVMVEWLASRWNSYCHGGTVTVTLEQLLSRWNSYCHGGTVSVVVELLVSRLNS